MSHLILILPEDILQYIIDLYLSILVLSPLLVRRGGLYSYICQILYSQYVYSSSVNMIDTRYWLNCIEIIQGMYTLC